MLASQTPAAEVPPDPKYYCETCKRPFEDLIALKIHCTKLNHTHHYQSKHQHYDPLKDSLEGLPQCAHCSTAFQTWKGLRDHINLGRCHPTASSQEIDTRALVHRPATAQHVQAQSFGGLFCDTSVTYEMINQCSFCRRWNADNTSMTHHYRRDHKKLYDAIPPHLKEIRALSGINTGKGTCRLCSTHCTQLSKHKCPVVYQMTAMHVAHNLQPDLLRDFMHPDVTLEDSPFQCQKCGTRCKSALALKQHQGSNKCKPTTNQHTEHYCQLCDTSYVNAKGLQRHMKRQHPTLHTPQYTQSNTLDKYINKTPSHAPLLPLSPHITTTTQGQLNLYRLTTHLAKHILTFLPKSDNFLHTTYQCHIRLPLQLTQLQHFTRNTTQLPQDHLDIYHTFMSIFTAHHHTPLQLPHQQLWLKSSTLQHLLSRLDHGLPQLRGRTDGSADDLHRPMADTSKAPSYPSPSGLSLRLQADLHTYGGSSHPSSATTGISTAGDPPRAHPQCALPRYGSHDVHCHRTRIHRPDPGTSSITMATISTGTHSHNITEDDIDATGAPGDAQQNPKDPGEVIPWKISISLRSTQGRTFHENMIRLIRSSATQIILMRLKGHSLQTSPAATAVHKLLMETTGQTPPNKGKGKGKGKHPRPMQ